MDGLDSCIELLESMQKEEIDHCFIEANVCAGGCVKGPASNNWKASSAKAKLRIEQQIKHAPADAMIQSDAISLEKDFYDRSMKEEMPSEKELQEILHASGKYKKEDELNCGACGYPTCREKASAVYQN